MKVTAQNLDGLAVARKVKLQVAERVRELAQPLGLAVVLLAADPASRTYAESKVRACREVGIRCEVHDWTHMTDAHEVYQNLCELSANQSLQAIMVEQPYPAFLDPVILYRCIPPEKDVEGISHENLGRLLLGRPIVVAATAAACMRLLDEYAVPMEGKRAVVVGRSNIVGKPLASLLMARNATVTICHRHTPNLAEETRRADILVVSVGQAHLIGPEHVKPGAVVIDVGINFVGGHMVGDVDTEGVRGVAGAITPVPGGVGPVTTALLLLNLVETAQRQLASAT
jgi:methylenetetrahydrofolate dehydrogenase (NADP+) / methenyltetrahydrofolate cyclohydrolase